MKLAQIVDALFPEKHICFLCGAYLPYINKCHLCQECYHKLMWNKGHICIKCGKALFDYDKDCCFDCENEVRFFKKATAPLLYKGLAKKGIRDYKFNGKSYYYKMWGEILYLHLRKEESHMLNQIDYIVSVPLTYSKKVKRGFNQTELLAQYISKKVDIPYIRGALRKVKNTNSQNKLNRLERSRNLKDAFEARDSGYYHNKRVLLIDDIFTTGSTVDEASRMLLDAGALEIYVATIATGRNI